MKNLTRYRPTIGELFGLDRILELNRVERIAISSSEDDGHVLYLFRCEDFLPEGHKLAVDDCRGMVGVYREGTILNETALSTMEIAILTALVLSSPFSVGQSQIQDVYRLYRTNEQDLETTSVTGDERFMNPVQDLVAACNERLRSLGIAIIPIDAAYQLTAESSEKHCA
jgi:hypothetical protein